MKNINIFIAGAKDLVEARRVFKVLANNFNAEYGSKQLDISLTMRSFEDFVENNNQMSYDDYIAKESDIVIFIIEGRIGAKTEAEFKIASNSLSKHGRPKIFVFMKQYDALTPDIAYVNGLMSTLLSDYYYTYRNYDHLESVAKDVLREAVDGLATKRVASGERRAGRAKLVSWLKLQRYTIITLLLAITALVVFMFIGRNHLPHRPITVVVGGGSVANYVEDSLKLDLKGYDDLIYFHMPSMVSLSVLGEEISDPNPRHHTFVFAAERADTMAFYAYANPDETNLYGSIMGAYLGDDQLVVAVANDPLIREYVGDEDFERGRISLDALVKILENDERFAIYTTSISSGTRKRYSDLVLTKGHTLSPYRSFNEKETIVPVPGRPSIYLQSQYFTSKDAKSEVSALKRLSLYDVVDGQEELLVKRMYVYFVGCGKMHKHLPKDMKQDDRNLLYVPQPIVDFLHDLGISTERIDKDNFYLFSSPQKIFYLNE